MTDLRYSRRTLGQLAAAFGLLASTRAFAGVDDAYEVVFESNIGVMTRDGVRLATDIYRPARDGKAVEGRFPVIMERTPYGRDAPNSRDITAANRTPKTRAQLAEVFVRHGYVVVFQDCRGRHGSSGEFIKYLREGDDGVDVCAWIVAQPWSDGKIGMIGSSYSAHTQAAAGSLNAPGLKALYLDCGGFSNAYQGGIRQGGAFEMKQVTWAYNQGLDSPELQADPLRLAAVKAVDMKAWFSSMPWKRGHTPISLIPEYEDYVYEQWGHGVFDGFWKQPGIYAAGYYDRFSDAAMVHMSGWYDAYSRTATENYIGLSRRRPGKVRLVMGPWTHVGRSTPYSGNVSFGPQSTIDSDIGGDFFEWRRAWFDHELKGAPRPAERAPPVRLFIMGGGSGAKDGNGRLDHGGQWRSESDWPIPDTQATPYYLHGGGRLSADRQMAGAAPIAYDFDPKFPVPTLGGTVTSGEPLMRGGAFDQREGPDVFGAVEPYLPFAARPDVLVFETEPLTEDMEVTGAITANLWIASNRPDTDFTLKLIDVYPPSADYPEGFAMNLTDGILRCRYRESWEKPTMMQPGQTYRIKIEAFPTANLFKKGHRIRLDISSSNFPHFDVNPNTGAPEGQGLTTQIATNTVFMDALRPSHIVLPMIPRRGSAG